MTTDKKKILLVEDEIHLQEALKLNLEMDGYQVDAVGDGASAMKLFKENNNYNLALLDVMLPDMDGIRFEFVEKFCKQMFRKKRKADFRICR